MLMEIETLLNAFLCINFGTDYLCIKGYLHLIKDRTDSRLKRENAINTRMAYFSSTLTLLIANRFSSDTTSSREIPSRVSSVGPIPNMIVLQSLTKVNRASE